MNQKPCCELCLIHLDYKTNNEYQCNSKDCLCHAKSDTERLNEHFDTPEHVRQAAIAGAQDQNKKYPTPHSTGVEELVEELLIQAKSTKDYYTDDGSTELSEVLFREKARTALTQAYKMGEESGLTKQKRVLKHLKKIVFAGNHFLRENIKNFIETLDNELYPTDQN
jgi:hypothetical protein